MRQRQAVLEPGMVFAFEPNACIGNHRVNIGGTVIVTSTGCEELNHIPTSVTHKQ
jgi:Xaa-Pro aminopeptidase